MFIWIPLSDVLNQHWIKVAGKTYLASLRRKMAMTDVHADMDYGVSSSRRVCPAVRKLGQNLEQSDISIRIKVI